MGTVLGVKAKRSSGMNLPMGESGCGGWWGRFGVQKVITHLTEWMHKSRNLPTSYPSVVLRIMVFMGFLKQNHYNFK